MKRIRIILLAGIIICVSVFMGSCTSEENQLQVEKAKVTHGTRSITSEVQQEITNFEALFINQSITGNPSEVGVFGYKTMMLEGKNKDVLKWVYENYRKEIDEQKGLFIASDFSIYRLYFPLHTAITDFAGKEYNANEKGIVTLPAQHTRASMGNLTVIGRIKSDKVTGCASNIITDDKIILKDRLVPTELLNNTYIFDMGLMDCCDSGQMRSTPCTQNHGSYANCSDAFGIWGDNCVTQRNICMDFNGYGSDCVKGPKTYFIGSDCQKAMLQGHCWNEIM